MGRRRSAGHSTAMRPRKSLSTSHSILLMIALHTVLALSSQTIGPPHSMVSAGPTETFGAVHLICQTLSMSELCMRCHVSRLLHHHVCAFTARPPST